MRFRAARPATRSWLGFTRRKWPFASAIRTSAPTQLSATAGSSGAWWASTPSFLSEPVKSLYFFTEYANMFRAYIFWNGDEIAVICQKCKIFRAFGVKKDPARLLLQGHFFYCGLQSGFAPKHEVPISACCGWQPVSSLLRSEYINVIKYKRYEIRHSTVPCTIYFIFFLPE